MPTLLDKPPKEIGRALLRALDDDNLEAARYFLTAPEVDVRCCHEKGNYTALHYAATRNYADLAEAILDKGANINAQDKEGCTPLHYVAKEGYEHIMDLLLNRGAAPNIKATRYFHTALHYAALMGHAGIVGLLLAVNTDMSVQDKEGCCPLHYAAKHGWTEVVRLLLEKAAAGGEVERYLRIRNKHFFTPLHFAVARNHAEVAGMLLQRGADPNVLDHRDYTPLHFAAHKNSHEIVRMLLQKGADISAEGKDGKRPQDLTQNAKVLADLHAFGAILEDFTPPENYVPIEAPVFSKKQEQVKEFNLFEKYFN